MKWTSHLAQRWTKIPGAQQLVFKTRFCHYLPLFTIIFNGNECFIELRKNAFTTKDKLVILRLLQFRSNNL